jgi:hypothetical protein
VSNVLADPPQYVSVQITDEVARPRTISGGSPGTLGVYPFRVVLIQVALFRDRVRQRDQICKLSGTDTRPSYNGLDACHIIPRSHHSYVQNRPLDQTEFSGRIIVSGNTLDLMNSNMESIAFKMGYFCFVVCTDIGTLGGCR